MLRITEVLSKDIEMKFGFRKCKTQSMRKGEVETIEYKMESEETARGMKKIRCTNTLACNNHVHWPQSIWRKYMKRRKQFTKTKLYGKNLIKAINTYAEPILAYFFEVI